MPSNHLILCRPLLLLPSIFSSLRIFSSELTLCIRWLKYWSVSFSISPFNEYSGLISFRIDRFDLLAMHLEVFPILHILKEIFHSVTSSKVNSESQYFWTKAVRCQPFWRPISCQRSGSVAELLDAGDARSLSSLHPGSHQATPALAWWSLQESCRLGLRTSFKAGPITSRVCCPWPCVQVLAACLWVGVAGNGRTLGSVSSSVLRGHTDLRF